MASGSAPSSLMLTYAATSSINHHQDSAAIQFLSLKPNFNKTLSSSSYTLIVLQTRRVSSNLDETRRYRSLIVSSAAAATDAVDALDTESDLVDREGDGQATLAGGGGGVVYTKPKTGKAALPVKRDRV